MRADGHKKVYRFRVLTAEMFPIVIGSRAAGGFQYCAQHLIYSPLHGVSIGQLPMLGGYSPDRWIKLQT